MTEETITISLKEYNDLKLESHRLKAFTEQLNELCGWGSESFLHATLHIGNFISNLKTDAKIERILRKNLVKKLDSLAEDIKVETPKVARKLRDIIKDESD